VPATAFCEPDEGKPARWHWFGIYRQWKGADQDLPNALTSTINHERSPVLLTEEAQFATCLTGTPEQAMGLITTPARMRIVQSGFEKKDLLEEA
jgi:hypothetical protein